LRAFYSEAYATDSNERFLLCVSQVTDPSALPVALRNLSVTNFISLMSKAKILRSRTPLSFRQHLFSLSSALPRSSSATVDALSSYTALLPTLTVPASEIVHHAYSEILEHGAMKPLLVDIRPFREFSAGHLPCAINLDPSILSHPRLLASLFEQENYGKLKGVHMVLIGNEMTPFSAFHNVGRDAIAAAIPPHAAIKAAAALLKRSSSGSSAGATQSQQAAASGDEAPEANGAANASPSPGDSSSAIGASNTGKELTSPLMDSYTFTFLCLFMAHGFPYVSVCAGGFAACHDLVMQDRQKAGGRGSSADDEEDAFRADGSNELIDHDTTKCYVCNPTLRSKEKKSKRKRLRMHRRRRSARDRKKLKSARRLRIVHNSRRARRNEEKAPVRSGVVVVESVGVASFFSFSVIHSNISFIHPKECACANGSSRDVRVCVALSSLH
jgi:hypothetical protein